MTPSQPQSGTRLEAGRELDARIAEKVMGFTRVGVSGDIAIGVKPGGLANNINHYLDIPHYSTDIAAAWTVVEKLRELGFYPSVRFDDTGEIPDTTAWFCECDPNWRAETFEAYAETASHAICLSALAAFANADPLSRPDDGGARP